MSTNRPQPDTTDPESPKTYTFTVRRRTLISTAVGVVAGVAVIVACGQWAWVASVALVVLASWLAFRRSRPHVAYSVDSYAQPSADAQLVANAIQDAEWRQALRRL